MNLDFYIARLAENVRVFEGLAGGAGQEQARWKPAPEKWSILEVVNHLYDEEREDFRQRLDYTLHRRGEAWPRIDPPSWVVERNYNERDLGESLRAFEREREQSLAWLRGLHDANWHLTYERPQGPLSAGDLLASWLAHDFLHVRQLARLHYDYAALVSSPFKTAYAGSWPSGG